MRALLQRVSHASVSVEGETVGKTGEGFLILLGVMQGDTEAQAIFCFSPPEREKIFFPSRFSIPNCSAVDFTR